LRFAAELGAFFVRNKGEFLFLLDKVYGSPEKERQLGFQLAQRGVDLGRFLTPEGTERTAETAGRGEKKNTQAPYPLHPSRIQMVMGATIFFVSREHFGAVPGKPRRGGAGKGGIDLPAFLRKLKERIGRGLGFIRERVEMIDFAKLERAVSFDIAFDAGPDEMHLKLLKAIGEVLAETGPFEASVEMFARKSGLSKSSLYTHFASREEMILSLFANEFRRIAKIAAFNKAKSDVPEERFYLTLIAIAGYLRTHTMILRAIDKARTRHRDYPKERYQHNDSLFLVTEELFSGIRVPAASGEITVSREDADYILFMLVNALMFRPDSMDYADVGNESMRVLFRFLTRGLGSL
jgi:AcrR family transcriptional regulator